MANTRIGKVSSKAKPFRYWCVEDFDPFAPIWLTEERDTKKPIGLIRRDGPNNYDVRRFQDGEFHSPHGSRREAARWLQEHRTDPTIYNDL